MICHKFGVYVAVEVVVQAQLLQLLAPAAVGLVAQVLLHHYLEHLYIILAVVLVLHIITIIRDQILYL
jgi:predicted Na+-dependent transporter